MICNTKCLFLLSTHLCLFPKQFVFDSSLFFFSHPFLMFFEVLPFPGLEVEPCVGEGTDLGQQSLNERMEFILHDRQTDKCKYTHIQTELSVGKPALTSTSSVRTCSMGCIFLTVHNQATTQQRYVFTPSLPGIFHICRSTPLP